MAMFEEITGMVVGAMDATFAPIMPLGPMVSLFVVSAVITVAILMLGRLLTNNKAVKELRTRMQELREQMTAAQKAGDKDTANKLLEQTMQMNNEFMKHSYKSLLVSLVVIYLFLPWLNHSYGGMTIASLPFAVPFVGSSVTWVLWYVLVSFTIGWVVRKLFGFE